MKKLILIIFLLLYSLPSIGSVNGKGVICKCLDCKLEHLDVSSYMPNKMPTEIGFHFKTNKVAIYYITKIGDDLDLLKGDFAACWITEFPMFEKASDGSLTSLHHPFTCPVETDLEKLGELNPLEINAVAPKLELEFVNEISPPFIHSKCFAYPIANIETA